MPKSPVEPNAIKVSPYALLWRNRNIFHCRYRLARFFQWRNKVEKTRREFTFSTEQRVKFVGSYGAVRNIFTPVSLKDLFFRQALVEIAEAVNHHLMRDNQYALAAIFSR